MVTLYHIFSSHGLYQQNAELTLRGIADGPSVRASIRRDGEIFSENTVRTEKGRFALPLKTPAGSLSPWEIRISDGEEKVLSDILFGELWIATGQSNMGVCLGEMPGHSAFYEKMKDLPIRGYDQSTVGDISFEEGPYPFEPMDDLEGAWLTSEDPARWNRVTALGAAVITELAAVALSGIPVGVVSASVGGTPIESWLPEEALCSTEESRALLTKERRLPTPDNHNMKEKWRCALYQQSTVLYNLKIMPLRGLTARGVLWYQGEANIGTLVGRTRADHYGRMMQSLHQVYSDLFKPAGQSRFPVVSSHLYPFFYGPDREDREEGLSYINDVFTRLGDREPEKFISVPIYDLPPRWNVDGNSNIHPMNKFELAPRMAAMIRAAVYGGPGMKQPGVMKDFRRLEEGIALRVDTKKEALWAKGEPRGFWISDWNGRYRPARAKIVSGDTLLVYREDLKNPAHAAYQYHTLQIDGNVYCGDLPLCPFATDQKEAVRLFPEPWLSTDENRVWAHDSDLHAFYTPVWMGENSEVVCDPVFTRGNGSLRIFGSAPTLCAYTERRRGELMDLWNYSALSMELYNLREGVPTLEITQTVDKGTRITVLKPEILPEEDNRNRLSFDLSGLSREPVLRIALRIITNTHQDGVWMEGLALSR